MEFFLRPMGVLIIPRRVHSVITHAPNGLQPKTLIEASKVFPKGDSTNVTDFVRAMPDEFKLDKNISTFDAYKMYIGTKPWVKNNYLKIPSRKPDWI
jgi:hypothetical protein